MLGRNEKSYMITEKAYEPYFFETKIKGMQTIETRGTWEVKKRLYGRPFFKLYNSRHNKQQATSNGRICVFPLYTKKKLYGRVGSNF